MLLLQSSQVLKEAAAGALRCVSAALRDSDGSRRAGKDALGACEFSAAVKGFFKNTGSDRTTHPPTFSLMISTFTLASPSKVS